MIRCVICNLETIRWSLFFALFLLKIIRICFLNTLNDAIWGEYLERYALVLQILPKVLVIISGQEFRGDNSVRKDRGLSVSED